MFRSHPGPKRRMSPPPILPFDNTSSSYSSHLSPRLTFRYKLWRLFWKPWLCILILLFTLLHILRILRIHAHLVIEHDLDTVIRLAHRHRGERVYIASMHWNDETLVREHWGPAVEQLVDVLGANNVFVSIYESGSWDGTKSALKSLDRQLGNMGVLRNVTLSDVTHKDEMAATPVGEGWIQTPRGKTELRRIPFLAKLRNRTLKDLVELNKIGIQFDKILFLNDVVFTAEDVLRLLDTNDGSYAAACSLDFSKPPEYYDTFALRDSAGSAHLMHTWPYFASSASRNSLTLNQPVPVRSCWNGIVAMPAAPFVSPDKPLRFRGISDSLALHHLEGSECCLIHADNLLSEALGVWLNPQVRVGYNNQAYQITNPSGATSWLSYGQIIRGVWMNRLRRLTTFTFTRDWIVSSRVKKWMKENNQNHEPGTFCLINEMQVLVENGWAHV